MENEKISEMSEVSGVLDSAATVPVVVSGANKSATVGQLRAGVNAEVQAELDMLIEALAGLGATGSAAADVVTIGQGLAALQGAVDALQDGLDQVDNTSDLGKPVSDATQAALDDLAAQSLDVSGSATIADQDTTDPEAVVNFGQGDFRYSQEYVETHLGLSADASTGIIDIETDIFGTNNALTFDPYWRTSNTGSMAFEVDLYYQIDGVHLNNRVMYYVTVAGTPTTVRQVQKSEPDYAHVAVGFDLTFSNHATTGALIFHIQLTSTNTAHWTPQNVRIVAKT